MEYKSVTGNYVKKALNNKSIPELMMYNHIWDGDDVEDIIAFACFDLNNAIQGLCVGAIYKKNSIKRCSQWNFEENRKRQLWIVHLHSNPTSSCSGTHLLKLTESKLIEESAKYDIDRRNIYTLSIYPAVGFYEKHGFVEMRPNPGDKRSKQIWLTSATAYHIPKP